MIIPQLFDIIAMLKHNKLTKKVYELFNYFLEEKPEAIVKTKFGYIFKDELFLDFIIKNINIFTNKKILDFLRFLSFQNFDYNFQYLLDKNKKIINVNKLIYDKFENYYFNIKYTSSKDDTEQSIEEELTEDIISIIHSFSGKLYGMRKKIVKEKINEVFNKDEN